MKKWLPAIFIALGVCGWSLDWKLPVWSLRSDFATGAEQDAEESFLLADSTRATVTVRVTEEADPLALALAVTGSLKDYLATEVGDYRYLKLEEESRLAVGDSVDLELDLVGKRMAYTLPDTDLRSKDYTLFTIGADARFALATATSFSLGLDARWEWWDAAEKSRQGYAAGASFSSRLGPWLLSARYRLEMRLPMGPGSGETRTVEQTGGLGVTWDPNRAR